MSVDQTNDIRRGTVKIFIMFVVLSIYSMGLAYAVEMPDAVDAAERVDKLGAVGVLAFGFILSLGTTAYLIRFVFTRLMGVIDGNTRIIAETSQTMNRVNEAIQHCRDK